MYKGIISLNISLKEGYSITFQVNKKFINFYKSHIYSKRTFAKVY